MKSKKIGVFGKRCKPLSAAATYAIFTLVVVAIAMGGIYAKYFYENDDGNGVVTAKNFYFTSDRLTAVNPVYRLAAGTNSVTFDLRNYADELRYADDNVDYEVTVTGDGATFGEPQEAAVTKVTGTIETGATNKDEITLSGLKDGETYVVTATGSAGYVKTLEATFTVDTADKVYKNLSTNGVQVILTIWTENVSGNVYFTIPAGLIPNVTESPELATVLNYSSEANAKGYHYGESDFKDNVNFEPYTTKKYHFIKEKSTDTYILNDIKTVQLITPTKNLDAIVGTP